MGITFAAIDMIIVVDFILTFNSKGKKDFLACGRAGLPSDSEILTY